MLREERLNTNQWDNLVSRIMQKEVKCYEIDSKKISEKFGNSVDCLEISTEGNRQYMSTRIRGNTENIHIPVYDIEEMGKEAWETVTGVKILFYLESSNIAGTEASIFQRYQNSQYKVFQQFLGDNDAYENMKSEVKEKYETMLKTITKAMDEYGAGGYNGISRKSMLLSQNMVAQLDYFNTNYVPDDLQAGFQKLIEECDYFNQNSREKMFADRMPCDIIESIEPGGRLVKKNKSVVIRNYLEYSRQEKNEISEKFLALKGKRELSDIYAVLQKIEKQYRENDSNVSGRNTFLDMKASWKKII
ncbi:MAG TPA: hypothetical protein DDY31_00255 [Lachnospiraceae bacterium]|nr:hypothetical protein [Lachnospiraceae bacterium]